MESFTKKIRLLNLISSQDKWTVKKLLNLKLESEFKILPRWPVFYIKRSFSSFFCSRRNECFKATKDSISIFVYNDYFGTW